MNTVVCRKGGFGLETAPLYRELEEGCSPTIRAARAHEPSYGTLQGHAFWRSGKPGLAAELVTESFGNNRCTPLGLQLRTLHDRPPGHVRDDTRTGKQTAPPDT